MAYLKDSANSVSCLDVWMIENILGGKRLQIGHENSTFACAHEVEIKC